MSEREERNLQTATRIITQPDNSLVLQVQKAKLVVVEGDANAKDARVPPHGLLVGTAPECGLVLDDPAVSRAHFRLTPGVKGFELRDLGSKNGTRVGDVDIVEAILHGGEEILAGRTRLRFSVLEEHEELTLSNKTSFGPLQGRSAVMRHVFSILERAADSESTLLVEGESGTGKDLVAETVHALSPRRDHPLVIVDAGSMQANLAESELFGHRKGAFTGADRDRQGAFESAEGGTVFLDEVGELDASLQPKLLRLLEKRAVKRLGENHYRPVDVRLIAATNRDLKTEVAGGRFREDLYYRLSVVQVRMPPLREHKEDIGLLARKFVGQLRPGTDPDEIITPAVLAMLVSHDWPGNVRELRNVVERLILFPDRPRAALAQSGIESGEDELAGLPFNEARRKWTERFEKIYLSHLLDACNGVVSKAADKAEISRQTFHRLMNKLGLSKE